MGSWFQTLAAFTAGAKTKVLLQGLWGPSTGPPNVFLKDREGLLNILTWLAEKVVKKEVQISWSDTQENYSNVHRGPSFV